MMIDPNYDRSKVDNQTNESSPMQTSTPPPQARSTCLVCDGTKRLVGRYIGSASRDDPDEHIFACSNCDDDGTVPASPGSQAELAAWQAELKPLLDKATITHDRGLPVLGLRTLLKHLAAMPQAQPDAELLGALKPLKALLRRHVELHVNQGGATPVFQIRLNESVLTVGDLRRAVAAIAHAEEVELAR